MHSRTTMTMPRAAGFIFRSLFLAVVAAGLAAAPSGAQQQPAPQQQVPDVPEEDLETFAEAYVDIGQLRQQMQSELQQAEGPEEANQIQQRANGEMESVLEDHGLTIERYQEITQVLNADPEQREEFEEILAEVTGEGL